MPTVSSSQLIRAAEKILVAAGTEPHIAQKVAENLVQANLKGHDSHGIGMVPRYVEAIAEGGLQPNAAGKLIQDSGAILMVDGGRGYGQSVGMDAVRRLAECAHGHGIALLGLSNVHHLGRIGAYAEQLAEEGLVSLHFVNVPTNPMVVAWGGHLPRFGTNPVCIGMPSKTESAPVILDFATSRLAHGKIRVAWLKQSRLADDQSLQDAEGKTTDDPGVLFREPSGVMMPFGEHKGAGLAMMCSLLGGALTGGRTERSHEAGESGMAVINGMLSIAIDPAAMGAAAGFLQEVEAFSDWVRASQGPDSQGEVLVPGEPERRSFMARQREGISVDDGTWGQLQAACRSTGLDPEEVLFPSL